MTEVPKYGRTTWGSTLCPWSLLPSPFSGLLRGGPERALSQINGERVLSAARQPLSTGPYILWETSNEKPSLGIVSVNDGRNTGLA